MKKYVVRNKTTKEVFGKYDTRIEAGECLLCHLKNNLGASEFLSPFDFDGNEGDVWEEDIEDLEFCEPRYKLPEWRKEECCDTIVSSVVSQYLEIEYAIDKYEDKNFTLFFHRNVGDTTNCKRVGKYPTLEKAKAAAEKHYNELVNEIRF